MEYIMSRRNTISGCYLSKSAYGNLRAALFHIFRLHNRLGFPDAFRLELGNLYRGFSGSCLDKILPLLHLINPMLMLTMEHLWLFSIDREKRKAKPQ